MSLKVIPYSTSPGQWMVEVVEYTPLTVESQYKSIVPYGSLEEAIKAGEAWVDEFLGYERSLS